MFAEIERASVSDARLAEAHSKTVVTHARKALIFIGDVGGPTRLPSPGPPDGRTWAIEYATLPPQYAPGGRSQLLWFGHHQASHRVKRVAFFNLSRSSAREIKRSNSSLKPIPLCCHILGYMLMEVKPGMVLISLM